MTGRTRGIFEFLAALAIVLLISGDGRVNAEDAKPDAKPAGVEQMQKKADELQKQTEALEKQYKEAAEKLEQAKKELAAERKKKSSVARIVLRGAMDEGAGAGEMLSHVAPRVRDIVDRIDKAAKDDKIAALLIVNEGTSLGLGRIEEVRTAVAAARKSGKKVIAWAPSFDAVDYLASVGCDQVLIPSSGEIMIPGLAAEIMYYKGLFEKLGVTADFIQVGDFKGASEPYTRTDMSPEFRKQYEAVIDDFFKLLVGTIASDRKLTEDKVRELIDSGLFTGPAAKEAGLVDRLCYEDELPAVLKEILAAEEVAIVKDYGKKKVDTDFSGLTGFVKLMEVMSGQDANKSGKSSKESKIAVIYAVGPIVTGSGGAGLLSGEMLGSETLIKNIEKAQEDSTVKAIVLRVDSPGGSALASDLIWRTIKQSKQPVVASMGDTAASGGYYISMGCQKIFAEPGTLTGSIGVVGGKMALRGLYDKAGLTVDRIVRGKNAMMFRGDDPFTESERSVWKKAMEEIYGQFTSKAAEGRKMPVEKLRELAQGKLYSGRMAKEVGLVDAVGTLEDAIKEAKSLGGLKPDEKVELLILPKPRSFLEELLGTSALDLEMKSMLNSTLPAVQEAAIWTRLLQEKTLMILPAKVTVE